MHQASALYFAKVRTFSNGAGGGVDVLSVWADGVVEAFCPVAAMKPNDRVATMSGIEFLVTLFKMREVPLRFLLESKKILGGIP